MKAKPTKPKKPPVKSFSVRLDTPLERTAFEKFCIDQSRSLDKQAGVLIKQALIENGYIKSKSTPIVTQ